MLLKTAAFDDAIKKSQKPTLTNCIHGKKCEVGETGATRCVCLCVCVNNKMKWNKTERKEVNNMSN